MPVVSSSAASSIIAGSSWIFDDIATNERLTAGRPYFLQMIEDVEIATRFAQEKIDKQAEFSVTGVGNAYTLASAVSQTLPGIKLISQRDGQVLNWSDLLDHKRELWPSQYLLPGGAYAIHPECGLRSSSACS